MDTTKIVREYYSLDQETRIKTLESRWHYDPIKYPNGPILIEEFNIPEEEGNKRKKKKTILEN